MSALPPAIEIRRFNHWFGSGATRKQVLFDINLTVPRGEIVIMNGPSGSGKTTLLTLIGALRTVQEGTLLVLGMSLGGAHPEQLRRVRRSIGFIFQMHNLIPSLSALRNVQMALALDPLCERSEADARATQLLDAVGLAHRRHYLPARLSGGQKQRVAIARALAGNPAILLADEPTASLDKQSGREVVELMQRLAREQQCTIFLVTHDNRILDIADRIVTLEDGRIVSGA